MIVGHITVVIRIIMFLFYTVDGLIEGKNNKFSNRSLNSYIWDIN